MRFFLVDRITELAVGERIRGIKNVTYSDETLHDHFPDYPIMPGALIVEAVAQLAGFLLEASFNHDQQTPLRPLLVQIQNAKFYEMAVPGDQLDITARLDSRMDAAAQVSGDVRAGEKRIARVLLTVFMKAIPSARITEQRRYLFELLTRDLKPPVPTP